MADTRIETVNEAEIETVLDEEFQFVGNLKFSESLMIKGQMKGEIKATGYLYVGEKARVEARIEAASVLIQGEVIGDVLATEKVQLTASAILKGDITAPDIVMESGCQFNGICAMRNPKEISHDM